MNNKSVLQELEALINGGQAHATFESAVENIPFDHLGITPAGLPYSIWQLTEHIRIAQWDILEFSRDSQHQSPKWPDEYWPKEKAPANPAAWNKSVGQIVSDRSDFLSMMKEAGDNLFNPIPHGEGQSLLREALLIADHNSYHSAEIIIIRRLLGDWK